MKLILTLLIFVCLPVLAENNLLEELSNKAKNVESFSGTFIQHRKITVLPLPLISAGEFSYHHQTGMVWQTLEPIQSKIHITHQGIQTDNSESTSNAVGTAQLAKTLLGLFSGDFKSLSVQFDIEVNGDNSQWHLFLTPKNRLVANQIEFIAILGKETTESVVIVDTNGDHTDLVFKTLKLAFIRNEN